MEQDNLKQLLNDYLKVFLVELIEEFSKSLFGKFKNFYEEIFWNFSQELVGEFLQGWLPRSKFLKKVKLFLKYELKVTSNFGEKTNLWTPKPP